MNCSVSPNQRVIYFSFFLPKVSIFNKKPLTSVFAFDRRIKKIESTCYCKIKIDSVNPNVCKTLLHGYHLFEIYYNDVKGNHPGCIHMIKDLLNEYGHMQAVITITKSKEGRIIKRNSLSEEIGYQLYHNSQFHDSVHISEKNQLKPNDVNTKVGRTNSTPKTNSITEKEKLNVPPFSSKMTQDNDKPKFNLATSMKIDIDNTEKSKLKTTSPVSKVHAISDRSKSDEPQSIPIEIVDTEKLKTTSPVSKVHAISDRSKLDEPQSIPIKIVDTEKLKTTSLVSKVHTSSDRCKLSDPKCLQSEMENKEKSKFNATSSVSKVQANSDRSKLSDPKSNPIEFENAEKSKLNTTNSVSKVQANSEISKLNDQKSIPIEFENAEKSNLNTKSTKVNTNSDRSKLNVSPYLSKMTPISEKSAKSLEVTEENMIKYENVSAAMKKSQDFDDENFLQVYTTKKSFSSLQYSLVINSKPLESVHSADNRSRSSKISDDKLESGSLFHREDEATEDEFISVISSYTTNLSTSDLSFSDAYSHSIDSLEKKPFRKDVDCHEVLSQLDYETLYETDLINNVISEVGKDCFVKSSVAIKDKLMQYLNTIRFATSMCILSIFDEIIAEEVVQTSSNNMNVENELWNNLMNGYYTIVNERLCFSIKLSSEDEIYNLNTNKFKLRTLLEEMNLKRKGNYEKMEPVQ